MRDETNGYVDEMMVLLLDLAKAFRMDEPQEVLHIDISFSQICAIGQVASSREPTMSEIGRGVSMNPSSLTRTMDKLVEKGFVYRKPDPEGDRKWDEFEWNLIHEVFGPNFRKNTERIFSKHI